jgi:hypothetical protein
MLLPLVLDCLGRGGAAAGQAFRSGWRGVPLPTFLAWVPQLLSRLDGPEGDELVELVEVGGEGGGEGRGRRGVGVRVSWDWVGGCMQMQHGGLGWAPARPALHPFHTGQLPYPTATIAASTGHR